MTRQQRRGRRGSGLDVSPARLILARLEAGLSQAQVAGEELTRSAISQFELGQARPSLAALQHIAERTGHSLEWFGVIIYKENQDGD